MRRLRRIKRLESSPFYGVLQGLKGGERAVIRTLARLKQEGYARLEDITFISPDNSPITYLAPILQDKGRQQIQSGQYLE